MKNKRIDGLRGLAAINVVLAHFVSAFLPMMFHKYLPAVFHENVSPSVPFQIFTAPFISIVYNGHLAVLIFFIISGYVLTLPYYSNDFTDNLVLKKRLFGRYLRLNLPIAFAILISYIIYKLDLYSNVQAAEISGSMNWFNQFYPNGITLTLAVTEGVYTSIFWGESVLIPALWTIKIEFIGSLYVLIYYISKSKIRTQVHLLVVLCLIYAVHQQNSIYYFALFFGSFLTRLKNVPVNKFFIFAVGYYFGAFQFKSLGYDFLPDLNFLNFDIWDKKTFYNAIGAAFITLAIVKGFGSKILETPFAQFLGKISYSVYLIHTIVLCSITSFLYILFPKYNVCLLANLVLYLVICILAAVVFEKVVDRKSVSIARKFSARIFTLN